MYSSIASKMQRLIGGFVDLFVVISVVVVIALGINFWLYDFRLSLQENFTLVYDTQAVYLLTVPILLVINWYWLKEGQTIGMRFVGIKVVMKNGRAATKVTVSIRLGISYLLEMFIPGVPLVNLVLLVFHPERRLLHDFLTKTKVVQAPDLLLSILHDQKKPH
ncbi:RDD family protein [Vibrio parahaemolyticus]|uniref:RDD family protein n=1 Tax=Vibrio parahaemolyticus TaxID=670 RepID=UPI001121FEC3|nr:RDD family protein [Vibrio parahaemolyticus]TOO51450.1 RDD family protein [Vibrio parahaemolyticus]